MPSPAVEPTLPAPPGSGRFPLYSPAEAAAATAWLASLPTRDALYGTADDRAYQKRVAGHPERLMPTGLSSAVWADGYRPSDGAVIDAKHVRDPGCTPRTLDAINEGRFSLTFTLDKDERELAKYAMVIANPANKARYLEIDTDDQVSIGYWEFLVAKYHIPNDVRYVP